MNSTRPAAADDSARGATPRQVPLASWYSQGLVDGFGDRLLMFDNTGAASLELLRFRPDLAAARGFEATLRRTVHHLAGFDHPAFPRVRAVEYLDGTQALALVSTHVPGKRLSEMFQGAPERRPAVHPAFVAWLVRWLTGALADLHAVAGATHGALTADRIVLAEGRLVLVEHVLGPALDELARPASRLWQEFGLLVPPDAGERPVLDGRTDVFQLASIALSLLVGRRLAPDDHARGVGPLIAEIAGSADGRSSAIVPSLCAWLERALAGDGRGFQSAREARDGFRELSGSGVDDDPLPQTREVTRWTAVADGLVKRMPAGMAVEVGGSRRAIGFLSASDADTAQAEPDGFRRHLNARNLARGLAVVAVAQGVFIASLFTAPTAPEPAPAPARVESPRSADAVPAPREEAGPAPAPSIGGAAAVSPAVQEADASPVALEPVAAAREQFGGLRLVTPFELQVLDGARILGSSADGPIMTTVGVHELTLVNTDLGYRSRLTVEVTSGEIASLEVQPPDGRVSINALPWAEVLIDGAIVGETPLGNVPVTPGVREIVFRHPQLGERRETLLVKPGVDTRISVAFDR
jgi:hypothetical protein